LHWKKHLFQTEAPPPTPQWGAFPGLKTDSFQHNNGTRSVTQFSVDTAWYELDGTTLGVRRLWCYFGSATSEMLL
jgi:hypothetical protein